MSPERPTVAPRRTSGKSARALAILATVPCLWMLVGAANAQLLSPSDRSVYGAAFSASDEGDWARAEQLADAADIPLPGKVLLWRRLSDADSGATFRQIAEFIRSNPDWPGISQLRRNAEEAMFAAVSNDEAIAWFETYPPLTANGLTVYGRALLATGQGERAASVVRAAWPDIGMGRSQQRFFLEHLGRLLTPEDHVRRLDALLWAGREAEAEAMYALVDRDRRALAEARLRLAARAPGVDGAVAAVPAGLRDDPGLIYERVRWRRARNLTEGAVEMLAQEPADPPYASLWWTERNILARRLFEARDYAGAYALTSSHRQTAGFPELQAEWFSGFLALRFLDRPSDALRHFQRLYERSVAGDAISPISRARGAYWTARSYEALGQAAEAQQWYGVAAQYDTAFYGQLAAERLGRPTVNPALGDPPLPAGAEASFAGEELVRIARMLHELGQTDVADRFLFAVLATAEDPVRHVLTGQTALDLGRPFLAVRTGKEAVRNGFMLGRTGYPVIELSSADPRAERALVFSVIRQESEFREDAVSSAGARGLMQLMPRTAVRLAGVLGITHSTGMLIDEPSHNIRLGSRFIADRVEAYRGSYVLAIAAYNAGPGRVSEWVAALGDPRRPDVDAIDWIESLPFYETRNYIQRVLETTQVYRVRLGGDGPAGGLSRDLNR